MNQDLPRVLLAGINDHRVHLSVLRDLQEAGHAISICKRDDALHVIEHDPTIAVTITSDEALLHDLRGHQQITRLRAHPVVVLAEEASPSDKGRVSFQPQARMLACSELSQL